MDVWVNPSIHGLYFITEIQKMHDNDVVDICALSNPSSLQPLMSTCAAYPSGNLPLQCIEIIQVIVKPKSQRLSL